MPQLSTDRNLPPAIRNLRLCSALKDCGALGVANAFDKSEAAILYVYDDETIGYVDWTDIEPEFISKCFKANNRNNVTIVLLPLDHRIVTGPAICKGGVCDCMLLTNNEMSLIEFKTNASLNYLTNLQRADEGSNQLWHTFDTIIRPRCVKLSIDPMQKISVDFHVVFDSDLIVTSANAELQDFKTQFLDEKKIKLSFDNEKDFL